MKDFGYCVWYIPENGPWHRFTNGFTPHVTIKHSLSYSDALRLYLAIDPKTIEVMFKLGADVGRGVAGNAGL